MAGTAEGGGVDAPKSQIAPETNPHWKACLVYLSGALVLLGIGQHMQELMSVKLEGRALPIKALLSRAAKQYMCKFNSYIQFKLP